MLTSISASRSRLRSFNLYRSSNRTTHFLSGISKLFLDYLASNPFDAQLAVEPRPSGLKQNKTKIKRHQLSSSDHVDPISHKGILGFELRKLAQEHGLTDYSISPDLIKFYKSKSNFRTLHDAHVIFQLSSGEGVVITQSETDPFKKMFVVVPFALKGDVLKLKLRIHNKNYAEGFIVDIIQPSSLRHDDLVTCKYFSKCSGCQLQMMTYQDQLNFKEDVIRRAYEQFQFNTRKLPISHTVASPLQYGYRTKITPHFNGDRTAIKLGFDGEGPSGRKLLDIDSCKIAKPVLSNALTKNRDKLEDLVKKYKRSGTILLRDKTVDPNEPAYTTDHSEIITQQIAGYKFKFLAGEFFQNNNTILPLILDDIKRFINPAKHKYIVDTYCGSGFFGISLSATVDKLIGIEISKGSLEFAKLNAQLNHVQNSEFHLGSSEAIFQSIQNLNPAQTVVVLDPSRKGSNKDYLNQLSSFKPDLIVYISCNVYSQARDLDYFVNRTSNGDKYSINTIKGYDFFPQTKHVESLAILKLSQG